MLGVISFLFFSFFFPGTMAEDQSWIYGRPPALFSLVLYFGITVVLVLVHCLTPNGEFYVSMIPLYAWEIILIVVAIFGMLVFVLLRNNDRYVEYSTSLIDCMKANEDKRSEILNRVDNDEDECESRNSENNVEDKSSEDMRRQMRLQNKLPQWTRFPARHFLLTGCMLGSIVIPIYSIYRAIEIFNCALKKSSKSKALLILGIVRDGLIGVYCIIQTIFVVWFQKKRCKTCLMKCYISASFAVNLTLMINAITNIIKTSNTIDLYHQTHTNTKNHAPVPVNETGIQEYFLKCESDTLEVDELAIIIHKYTYHFTVEYASFALCFLVGIWNCSVSSAQSADVGQKNTSTSITSNTLDQPSYYGNDSFSTASHKDKDERTPLLRPVPRKCKPLRQGLKSTIIFVSRHALILALILIGLVLTVDLYTDIQTGGFNNTVIVISYYRENVTYPNYLETYSILQTVYTYVLCILAFIGFLLVSKQPKSLSLHGQDRILLLAAAAGHLLLVLLETVDSVEQFLGIENPKEIAEKILFLVKILLHYVGIYSQTMLVINANRLEARQYSLEMGSQLYITGILTFIGICNIERWAADSFMTPTVLKHVHEIHNANVYDQKVWWYITELLYPLVTLWRLISALMCFEARVRFKKTTNHRE